MARTPCPVIVSTHVHLRAGTEIAVKPISGSWQSALTFGDEIDNPLTVYASRADLARIRDEIDGFLRAVPGGEVIGRAA